MFNQDMDSLIAHFSNAEIRELVEFLILIG